MEEAEAEEQQRFSHRQMNRPFMSRGWTVVEENFAKDLEMFARHAKRSTVTTEDVKLLARRSNSLLKYITEKNEEIAQLNLERKAKKKRKPEDENRDFMELDADVVGSDS
ncbi:centromere protein S-like protein [Cricetulus griseus]|nr:centromere protein S-like protein [Cricetulus griseus]